MYRYKKSKQHDKAYHLIDTNAQKVIGLIIYNGGLWLAHDQSRIPNVFLGKFTTRNAAKDAIIR